MDGVITKVVKVEVSKDGKRTEHELTGDELKKWAADNGYNYVTINSKEVADEQADD